jgi:hypothetical protein
MGHPLGSRHLRFSSEPCGPPPPYHPSSFGLALAKAAHLPSGGSRESADILPADPDPASPVLPPEARGVPPAGVAGRSTYRCSLKVGWRDIVQNSLHSALVVQARAISSQLLHSFFTAPNSPKGCPLMSLPAHSHPAYLRTVYFAPLHIDTATAHMHICLPSGSCSLAHSLVCFSSREHCSLTSHSPHVAHVLIHLDIHQGTWAARQLVTQDTLQGTAMHRPPTSEEASAQHQGKLDTPTQSHASTPVTLH